MNIFRFLFCDNSQNEDVLITNKFDLRSRLINNQSEKVNLCSRLIKNNNIRLFIDLGANYGEFTNLAKENSYIICKAIEPNPIVFEKLKYNFIKYKNIETINKAVSNKIEIIKLKSDLFYSGSGTSLIESVHKKMLFNYEFHADTVRICDLIGDSNKFLVKMDIEGMELNILGDLLKYNRDFIVLTECNRNQHDFLSYLNEFNELYKYKFVSKNGVLFDTFINYTDFNDILIYSIKSNFVIK